MEQNDRPVGTRTVADAMTKSPVTIEADASLADAMTMMRSRHIRRLLVVAGDRLVGLVAEGDLKRAQPSIFYSDQDEYDLVMEQTEVHNVMIKEPETVAPETPLRDALERLHKTKFGSLPVVDADGHLVGILTDNDAVRVAIELLDASG